MMNSQDFFLALRVVVGITCVVSICGACVIILTYVAFKDLRTLARQQLVNLSVADIVVAGSHIVGLMVLKVETYDGSNWRAINYDNINISNTTLTVQERLCRVQAGFTMCGSIASFLWSLALGLYMLMIIVLRRPEIARYMVLLVYYPVCWGLPLALTLWFALRNPTYLGFVEDTDIGWCYVRLVPTHNGTVDHSQTIIAHLLGYGLWFYITVVALVVIYFTMLCYLKCRRAQGTRARRPADLKLVLVPLIFLLLRMWSAIIDTFTIYIRGNSKHPFGDEGTYSLVFIAGIGDSAQGLANAILFCAFTKQVRQKLLKSLHSCLCCCCPKFTGRLAWMSSGRFASSNSSHVNSHETTTQLDTDSSHSWAYRGDQMDDVSDSAALLKGSCNYDPFERDKYGATSQSLITDSS